MSRYRSNFAMMVFNVVDDVTLFTLIAVWPNSCIIFHYLATLSNSNLPKIYKNCQSRLWILPDTKWTLISLSKIFESCPSGKISPNLITLVVTIYALCNEAIVRCYSCCGCYWCCCSFPIKHHHFTRLATTSLTICRDENLVRQ